MKLDDVAFLFPGQGSQHVGMGRDMRERYSVVRELFAEADETLGCPLSQIISDGPEALLRQTSNTQPAVLLVSVAAYRVLGLEPAVVAGHSLGEYSALVAAGGLAFRDALSVVRKRGQYMQDAVPEGTGVMLALIGADTEAIERAIDDVEGTVDIANYNAPGQIVIAGAREATQEVAKCAGARHCVEIPVSAPFHCRLMQPAEERLNDDLDRVAFADLAIPLYNNVDARRVTSAAAARDGLKRQVSRAVRWTETIRAMIQVDGIRTFVEVGPGNVLSGLVRRIDRNVQRLVVNDCETADLVRAQLCP